MDKRYYEDKEYAQSMYALKHLQSQRNITTLTDEQPDVLADLCDTRHILHVKTFNRVSKDEGSFESESYENTLEKINTNLKDVGLAAIDGFKSLDDYYPPCCYDSDIDGDWDDYIFENSAILQDIIDFNDTLMRDYLKEIDVKYHTTYCPVGNKGLL